MNRIITFCIFIVILAKAELHTLSTQNQTLLGINYLNDYGYLTVDNNQISEVNITTFQSALKLFQEYYNLDVTGALDEATLELMNTPRCGALDDEIYFSTNKYKWTNKNIKWHYAFANSDRLELTRAAFEIWGKHTDLTFENNIQNPDIIISYKRGKPHRNQKIGGFCTAKLDGRGGVLAHASYPNSFNSPVEIHIDQDEYWYYNIDENTPENQVNFFSVLLHEIGHALGVSHSNNQDAIMYAYNKNQIKLNQDDILAIQSLYGKPSKEERNNTHDDERPKTNPTPSSPQEVPDLCNLNNVNTFLIVNQLLYIFYGRWFWISDLDNSTSYKNTPPQLITDWLTFLPQDFKTISAVYQRPSGEVVIIVDNKIYMINYPNLMLVQNYPISLSVWNMRPNTIIHAVVNTYSGYTYLFYNDAFFTEIDECSFKPKQHGIISRKFPGLPPAMDSAFRYINGMLYFFKDRQVYQYNEFTNSLVKAEKFDLSMIGIDCPKRSSSFLDVIKSLKSTVAQLEEMK